MIWILPSFIRFWSRNLQISSMFTYNEDSNWYKVCYWSLFGEPHYNFIQAKLEIESFESWNHQISWRTFLKFSNFKIIQKLWICKIIYKSENFCNFIINIIWKIQQLLLKNYHSTLDQRRIYKCTWDSSVMLLLYLSYLEGLYRPYYKDYDMLFLRYLIQGKKKGRVYILKYV